MKDNYFIGIAGIIAAGKTTLTKDLAKTLGYKAYFEPVKQNPYLSDFYKDMKRWGAFMQIHLLHARYEQHQRIVWGKGGAVQDRTIYEDTIFADILKNAGYISEREMKTYHLSFRNMTKSLVYPDVIVYLDVKPEKALEKIAQRGREAEQTITLDYLISLHKGYQEFIEEISRHTQVIKFDWNSYKKTSEIAQIIRTECSKNRKFLRSLKRLGSSSRE